MTTRTPGRHRAAVRPKTPLTGLTEAVAAHMGTMSRRSAVIAASSGLVLTTGLPAATAEPREEPLPQPAVATVVQDDATVSVPADATVSFAGSVFTAATPPPPPPPAVEEREERGERSGRASRSSSRESRSGGSDSGGESSARGGSIVDIAKQYTGIMYKWGGTTPAGFDCSGFTQYVYRKAGISLPRTSGAQASAGRRVSRSEARPGDLVWTPGHIGIYVGGNKMIDSPRTGKPVAVREMWFDPTFIRVS